MTRLVVPGLLLAGLAGLVETLAAQALAAVFVIGSYCLAEHVRVRRPRRRGASAAVRASRTPQSAAPLA